MSLAILATNTALLSAKYKYSMQKSVCHQFVSF